MVCEAGNGTLSSLGKLARYYARGHRGKVWGTPLLSLFLVLSLLLVVAGDVETNPGPINGEGKHCSYGHVYVNMQVNVASQIRAENQSKSHSHFR